MLRAGWAAAGAEAFVRAVCAAARAPEVGDRVRAVADTAERLAADEPASGRPKLREPLGHHGGPVVTRVTEWLLPRVAFGPAAGGTGAAAGPKPPSLAPLPPWGPFPVGHLPAVLRDFTATVAAAVRCDPTYAALPALAACAGMAGATRRVRLKKSWCEPACVWAAVVGESGTLKTPPYKRAVAPAAELQAEKIRAHRDATESYRADFRRYERDEKRSKDDDPGDPPPEPVCPRVHSRDATVEALAGLLAGNRTRSLAGRDEVSGWPGSFNQYRAKGGSDLANWSERHPLGTPSADRETGGPKAIFAGGVGVSLCGGIQPGVLKAAPPPSTSAPASRRGCCPRTRRGCPGGGPAATSARRSRAGTGR